MTTSEYPLLYFFLLLLLLSWRIVSHPWQNNPSTDNEVALHVIRSVMSLSDRGSDEGVGCISSPDELVAGI